MRSLSLPLLCLLALSGCMRSSVPHPTLAPLLASIEQRLDLAEAVALHKWDNRQPVQAPQREQQVLASVRQAAAEYGLSAQRAEAFFSDQIEANKLAQYHLLSQWHRARQAPDRPRRDLASEVRPQLDQLQAQLLRQLADLDRQALPQCQEHLADSLIHHAPDTPRRLAMIRATAQLCQQP
ncbi:chorismate mutase [Pseudomonas entomophila]|uniref:chorismate mutase n=1 Tax=Pseudomonas entomophila TaxID=312306 RepID=UPI0023D8755F|nr:chorismate mutase [Pseudomonas entomophila]MDF0733998.1 chorismate mutase [Pseudomonas entomophila]